MDISNMDESYCDRVINVLSNKYYRAILAAMTLLFFIITGVQYWLTDYMINYLHFEESTVFISYAIICVTGPVLGVAVGGSIITKFGGYTTKSSIITALVFATCTLVSAIPIPFLSSYWPFVLCLWFLLFFGGAILPVLTGIMLNTVNIHQKTTANSLANLSYNLFGFLPAPAIYGIIYDSGEGGNSRLAMGFILYFAFFSVSFLCYGVYEIFKNDIFKWDLKSKDREL
jgi:sugar phosphate permease